VNEVCGRSSGDPATGDATLKISALTGVTGMIESLPLEQAAEGYARMMSGKARFRVVSGSGHELPVFSIDDANLNV
jgi:alcohol dehydrogenase, propanol-preferring